MDEIRITSGLFRGRKIKSPRSSLTHPMGSREKLALFNMINEFLPSAIVLDAFSGSGALGIEALSRGAKDVVFVENNPKTSRVIKENCNDLGLDNADVITTDVSSLMINKRFDVILADPPYNNFKVSEIEYLTKYLKNDGILALSHPGEAPKIKGLDLKKSHKYANATISVYDIMK